MNERLVVVAETLRSHEAAGGRATFMGVPVRQLSREALLGLVGYFGEEQLAREDRTVAERAMWKDLLRARGQR